MTVELRYVDLLLGKVPRPLRKHFPHARPASPKLAHGQQLSWLGLLACCQPQLAEPAGRVVIEGKLIKTPSVDEALAQAFLCL